MRRMVTDGTQMFRVVVVTRNRAVNPEYAQGNGQPYWLLLDETTQTEYGPYNQIGTAKAVLTGEKLDPFDKSKLKWGVVDGWIEEAETVWRKVEL